MTAGDIALDNASMRARLPLPATCVARQTAAFTLAELLVTIGVLVLLGFAFHTAS